MPDRLRKKPNTFAQKVHDAYDYNVRKVICITTGLTALLCKISLQFCCEFIDNNRSNIFFIRNVARWVKFPTSILYIAHSAFTLHDLIKDCRDPKGKKELAKIVGKSAGLASSTIEALMMLRVFHLLTGGNASAISHIYLTSTVLFLFISEPISYYYTYKKYQKVHKEYQDACRKYAKGTDEFTKCEAELAKRRKDLIVSTLTLSLGLLNFILRRIEITTIPIDLGNGVIYNFNLSVTISIIYSTVFLVVQLDRLFNQPINDDPSTELDSTNHQVYRDTNSNLPVEQY
ncbi:hypothetical protein HET73_03150 [Wolbachia endosymbiont of Atemnus politus]|uniref:hypothetical protein n=1 Tax=Wolbachia endosymbiont of Atemnus politus TaxID=2682840 RepID=UPI001573BA86|nr:hypothetical protein [Wolbachia endosymbiont of Atemnus politus]NSM56541.1 hypothetical protein [Wolbachia endosymbiont of Atemnus politus]NSX83105.1 hypothetical protein [Wolbachia endosymbiont of Atemnus politus]